MVHIGANKNFLSSNQVTLHGEEVPGKNRISTGFGEHDIINFPLYGQ